MRQIFALVALLLSVTAQAAETVTIYSYRQPFLIAPMLEKFTAETGIETEVVFAKKGLDERLKREGRLTPADVMLTTDISRLANLVAMDLVQPVESEILTKNLPAQYRDPSNNWFALTVRVRNVYSSKERVGKANLSYEDLAKPEFKGKICTRSGKNAYNIALVSSMIAHHGETKTIEWLQGVKANLARKPQGNDRAQIKAIAEGVCDYAIGNSYYFGKMLSDEKQRPFADQVEINFPNQADRGAHVNVSGAALTKYSKHPEAAIKLLEFLSAPIAQQMYAEANMEYPVNPMVKPSELVSSWGSFKSDDLPVHRLAEYHQDAVKLLDKVKFDL
ncbi:Fe(3+) ABC transporter substrate-binding protein [Ferrimonas lipolytica]|uniref:Fe(3+) ABC transporter substrate-binding protein n=1 Tax=Ferrimonas lipolytica TaxID=2724191 RepID=A0A6H1UHS3_9GAMM|nr:Fe(3+) ABC transporter substrate-binding protein [Ferrimonas lipolytica]QIZ77863.1 Fe(3+) ABC transporter substrate-binding protein [Ferrimonas lipolytica]